MKGGPGIKVFVDCLKRSFTGRTFIVRFPFEKQQKESVLAFKCRGGKSKAVVRDTQHLDGKFLRRCVVLPTLRSYISNLHRKQFAKFDPPSSCGPAFQYTPAHTYAPGHKRSDGVHLRRQRDCNVRGVL